jgi:ABC-2 type transport system ATP-binding protein
MIQVNGLTKDYGPRRAIDNLTFRAEKGEILGFLGPNGAGKTTTMRILCGFMPPTYGNAEVAGYDVVEESLEVRRRVGYVPENVPLYPDMTVFEYLRYMGELRHLTDLGRKLDHVINQVQLNERSNSYISSLSKGMWQRVGLAQALLHQPEVLILDEPTLGLDPAQIIEVRNLIKNIGVHHTVLLSTHILSEAQQVCDRVLIINKGQIIAEDTPENLHALLTGAQRIVLQVSGDTDGLEDVVARVHGVTHVGKVEDNEIIFETAPGQDVRSDVARAVVGSDYNLVELRSIGISLEDIFLQLTRDEPNSPNTLGSGE